VNKSRFDVTLKLTDAKLRPPHLGRGIDRATMTLRATDLPVGAISVTLENLEARSAEATVTIPRAHAVVDPGKRHWLVDEMSGKAVLTEPVAGSAAQPRAGASADLAPLYGTADFKVLAGGGWGPEV